MTIRTVEQSPYISAQGEVVLLIQDDIPGNGGLQPMLATVRTGPNTTATGRLIEREQR